MEIKRVVDAKTKFTEKQFEIGNTYYYIMRDKTTNCRKLGEILQVVDNKFRPRSISFFNTDEIDIRSILCSSEDMPISTKIKSIVSEDITELNIQLYNTIEYCDNMTLDDTNLSNCTVVVIPYSKFHRVMLKGTKEDESSVIITSYKHLTKICERRNAIIITFTDLN